MTNFERAENDILGDAKLAKRYAKTMELGGIWTAEQADEYLNKKLVSLQKKWFELHRQLVEA